MLKKGKASKVLIVTSYSESRLYTLSRGDNEKSLRHKTLTGNLGFHMVAFYGVFTYGEVTM